MPGTISERTALVLDPGRAAETLRTEATGANVLAVLGESSSDEWHRRWHREVGVPYEQMGIVETYELARSSAAAAPATNVVNPDLAVTAIRRPVDPAVLGRVVGQYLEGWADSDAGTFLFVESFDAFLADLPVETLLEMADGILERARDVDATVRVQFDDAAAPAIATVCLGERFETFVGTPIGDPAAVAALQRLRESDPTNFGYFRNNWRDALRALDASTRTYPQAKQLHADLVDTDTSPRTLGAALSALERLGALELWGDTVGPNRYDLTSYDSSEVAKFGLAVESLAE